MSEEQEREQLKTKTNECVGYIKENSAHVRELIRIHISGAVALSEIDAVFRAIETYSGDIFDNGKIENLQYIERIFDRFAMAIKGFLRNVQNENTRNELIESAKAFNNFTQALATNKEVKKIAEGKIDSFLSNEFASKAASLNKEAANKLGALDQSFFLSFRMAILVVVLINMALWYFYIDGEIKIQNTSMDFWHFMILKLTVNIPLIFYVLFTLNEYIKAKKLYEEFDYKRIVAITLINNYKQLKNEFEVTNEQALKLIQSSFEKIFDNPVHSIYGNKSEDKNLNIAQIEKLFSLIKDIKG